MTPMVDTDRKGLSRLWRWQLAGVGLLGWLIILFSTVGVTGGVAYKLGAFESPPASSAEPAVGLYWQSNADPTVGPGVSAPLWQLLWRTDVPSIYYKSGSASTAWTKVGAGAGGGAGTVTSVACGTGLSCSPNPITATGTANLSINGGVTQTCSAGQAVTSMTSAGLQSCTAFTPSGSISGTTNTVAKFTSSTAIGNSAAADNGTTFSIGSPAFAVTEATGATSHPGTATFAADAAQINLTGTGGESLAIKNNGTLIWDIDPLTAGGTDASTIRFFRHTNTSGALSVDLGIGNSTTIGTHLTAGTASLFGGSWFRASPGSGTAFGGTTASTYPVTVGVSGTGWAGQTAEGRMLYVNNNLGGATFDTTAGALGAYAIYANANASRSAGANTLTDYAVYATASTGTVNYSGYFDQGQFHVGGAADFGSSVAITGTLNAGASTLAGVTVSGANSSFSSSGTPVSATLSGAGLVATRTAITAINNATYNATATARVAYGVNSSVTATRSAGANTLTNVGLYGTATGAQVNDSLWLDDGNMLLGVLSGNIQFGASAVTLIFSQSVPTANHGTLSSSASNTAGRITSIGANTSVTLTFGASGFGTTSYCVAQVEGSAQGIYVTPSATAPVFNCFNTTTDAAANCNDFTYYCVGH